MSSGETRGEIGETASALTIGDLLPVILAVLEQDKPVGRLAFVSALLRRWPANLGRKLGRGDLVNWYSAVKAIRLAPTVGGDAEALVDAGTGRN